MNWDNLKQKKCPICGRKLLMAHLYMRCSGRKGGVYKINNNSECKFTIRKSRYTELGGFINKSKDSHLFRTTAQLDEMEKQEKIVKDKKKKRKGLKKALKRGLITQEYFNENIIQYLHS